MSNIAGAAIIISLIAASVVLIIAGTGGAILMGVMAYIVYSEWDWK